MSKKSGNRNRVDVKRLGAEVKQLRARVEKYEAATAKWRARAKRFESEAIKTAKELLRLKKLRKREAKARDNNAEAVVLAAVETPTAADLPDESWTVARLRTLAREAGVPGYSRMTKASLLDALADSPRP